MSAFSRYVTRPPETEETEEKKYRHIHYPLLSHDAVLTVFHGSHRKLCDANHVELGQRVRHLEEMVEEVQRANADIQRKLWNDTAGCTEPKEISINMNISMNINININIKIKETLVSYRFLLTYHALFGPAKVAKICL